MYIQFLICSGVYAYDIQSSFIVIRGQTDFRWKFEQKFQTSIIFSTDIITNLKKHTL